MSKLLDLPESILEEIISYALGFTPSISNLRDSAPFKIFDTDKPHQQQTLLPPVASKTLPQALFLTCSQLLQRTTRICLQRGIFETQSTSSLRRLQRLLGPFRLSLLRNISLNTYTNEADLKSHGYQQRSAIATQDLADILNQLPPQLRSLKLSKTSDFLPHFSTGRWIDPSIITALHRLSNLRVLELDFYMSWLHISLLSSQRAPNPPIFPSLRALSLLGTLARTTTHEDLTYALSAASLPCLQILTIEDLFFELDRSQDPREREDLFAPETLLTMNPLKEFRWICHDGKKDPSRMKGLPHPPPGKLHFDALKRRHETGLKRLGLVYRGYEVRGAEAENWKSTMRDALLEVICEWEGLEWVLVDAPQVGLTVMCGESEEVCPLGWVREEVKFTPRKEARHAKARMVDMN